MRRRTDKSISAAEGDMLRLMHRRARGWLVAPWLLVALGGSAPVGGQEANPEAVTYGCGDTVVIGRIVAENFTPTSESGELLGGGRIELNIAIKQVMRGRVYRSVVPAWVYAHSFLRRDVDFLFVLSPGADGKYYSPRGVALARNGISPRVAPACTRPYRPPVATP